MKLLTYKNSWQLKNEWVCNSGHINDWSHFKCIYIQIRIKFKYILYSDCWYWSHYWLIQLDTKSRNPEVKTVSETGPCTAILNRINEIWIKLRHFRWRDYIWKCHLQNYGHFFRGSHALSVELSTTHPTIRTPVDMLLPGPLHKQLLPGVSYSISQEICTRFCCALLCCGYAIVRNEFTWSIYPYSSGLLCWHWGNR